MTATGLKNWENKAQLLMLSLSTESASPSWVYSSPQSVTCPPHLFILKLLCLKDFYSLKMCYSGYLSKLSVCGQGSGRLGVVTVLNCGEHV